MLYDKRLKLTEKASIRSVLALIFRKIQSFAKAFKGII